MPAGWRAPSAGYHYATRTTQHARDSGYPLEDLIHLVCRERAHRLAASIAGFRDVEQCAGHALLVRRLHHGDHIVLPLSPVDAVNLETSLLAFGNAIAGALHGGPSVLCAFVGESVEHNISWHLAPPSTNQ